MQSMPNKPVSLLRTLPEVVLLDRFLSRYIYFHHREKMKSIILILSFLYLVSFATDAIGLSGYKFRWQ